MSARTLSRSASSAELDLELLGGLDDPDAHVHLVSAPLVAPGRGLRRT